MDRADVAVEQWGRERPDLPLLPMSIFGRLSEAAERVAREHLNPLFAEAGLQPGEFDVLATLRRSGDLTGALAVLRLTYERVKTPYLLWPMAELHAELLQPMKGLEALS